MVFPDLTHLLFLIFTTNYILKKFTLKIYVFIFNSRTFTIPFRKNQSVVTTITFFQEGLITSYFELILRVHVTETIHIVLRHGTLSDI